ncbi:hypothetical protein VHP8226_03628 [Vibrio hippocampi]|uniref:Uncharacterized protein n=1 Tax=Vibrio hippocampi TaxID=654686 RepID=A0ABN8DS86_9VIBR|nr:hypothetical protein VHP8226_03628 [Vibrio hippocampi]
MVNLVRLKEIINIGVIIMIILSIKILIGLLPKKKPQIIWGLLSLNSVRLFYPPLRHITFTVVNRIVVGGSTADCCTARWS